MREPEWIEPDLARLVHREQLKQHGGLEGIRDVGRLEAAMTRPRTLFAYEQADLFRLASCYAHALAAGHPFVDGNKRTSFVVSMTFLAVNGIHVTASAHDVEATRTGLASGTVDEAELARWFQDRSRRER